MQPIFPSFQLDRILFDLLNIAFLIGFFLYVIFAFIALRQIDLMRKTVVTPFSPVVLVIGILHFLAALALLVFAFFFLKF